MQFKFAVCLSLGLYVSLSQLTCFPHTESCSLAPSPRATVPSLPQGFFRHAERGCLTPTGIPPELKLEQGRQQPPAPAQGLNKKHPVQVITKWSPCTVRSMHSWGRYASSGKSLIFLGYSSIDHIQLIGTTQVWTICLCLNFSA